MSVPSTIERQRRFFQTGATRDVAFRARQLQTLQRALKEHEAALLAAIYEDFRKSSFDTQTTELALVHQELREAQLELPRWAKAQRVPTNWINLPGKSYVIPEPLGTSLIIGAWNYPYQLSLLPVVSALAAGNTVILKPSELPAQTGKALAELVATHFNPAYFTVVEGGAEQAQQLLEHRFDKVFFTGSAEVGKLVYQAAAKHLTPVTLELGGKSPAIVARDCDLRVTARRLMWAKYLNAGQTCVAPDYLLVDAAVESALLQACRDEILRAEYSFENGNYVQIINDRHFDRLAALIDHDKVYFGGHCDRPTRYIEPTILTDVGVEHPSMQEEIFGPLLPVVRYTDVDAALAVIRERPRPLACYVFSNDRRLQERVVREVPFGGGAINDAMMHLSNSRLPFGGVGQSGFGSYHGEAGFRTFSHYKSVLKKSVWPDPSLRYSPHTETKLRWVKKLLRAD